MINFYVLYSIANFYQVITHVQLMIDSVEKLLQWGKYTSEVSGPFECEACYKLIWQKIYYQLKKEYSHRT
jgi:hypothetical protein